MTNGTWPHCHQSDGVCPLDLEVWYTCNCIVPSLLQLVPRFRKGHTVFGIVEGEKEGSVNHFWAEGHRSRWIDDLGKLLHELMHLYSGIKVVQLKETSVGRWCSRCFNGSRWCF